MRNPRGQRTDPSELLDTHALFGELSLDGEVRACHGTLAVAEATKKAGLAMLVLGPARACEATLVEGLCVGVVERLSSAARVLSGGAGDRIPKPEPSTAQHTYGRPRSERRSWPDRGCQGARRRCSRSPQQPSQRATGDRQDDARRTPSLDLAPAERSEAIEVMRIHSAIGKLAGGELLTERPFRAPHHSITTAGLIGGSQRGWVGEAVLAHNGSTFSRRALGVRTSDARGTAPTAGGRSREHREGAPLGSYIPARFMLVAATNPCPCGYAGERERCACSEADLARHRRRLSGPLLDRIDLLVHLERTTADHLAGEPSLSSEQAREQVIEARQRQARRLRADGILVNAQMDTSMLRRHLKLDEHG